MEIPKFNISVHCPTSQETKMNNIVWLLFILDLYFFWYLQKGRLEGEEVHRITDCVGQRIHQGMQAAGTVSSRAPHCPTGVCVPRSLSHPHLPLGGTPYHAQSHQVSFIGRWIQDDAEYGKFDTEEKLRLGWLGHRMARLDEGPTDNPGTAISKEPPLGLMEGQKLSLSNH